MIINGKRLNIMAIVKNLLLIFFVLMSNTIQSQSYLGTITKQVNFREGPSSDYEIINSLKAGTQIFISSIETVDDFYNIIDIKTNKEGYVHKSYVKVGKLVSRSNESVFTPNGETTTYESEVKIFNNTSKTLTLKMNTQLFYFSPYETKNISINPDEYDFRASAPGVIPYIGTERLKSKQAYSWEFYISTSYR
jgi:SH3-like domain-containing protein